jgi:hypothetical protein
VKHSLTIGAVPACARTHTQLAADKVTCRGPALLHPTRTVELGHACSSPVSALESGPYVPTLNQRSQSLRLVLNQRRSLLRPSSDSRVAE